jgi:GT2 family glycosyltransferase
LNPDGTEQRGSRRGEVTPVTSLLSLTGLSRRLGGLHGFEVHHQDDPAPKKRLAVPTISGACFAMRRQDFLAMNGFDNYFFLHVEDVDLCWRVRQAGGSVLFEPRAEVVHLGSTSLKSPMKVEMWKGVGLARFFRKRADNPARVALAIVLTPVIIGVSILRPILRGQAFKRRGGLRF